MTRRERAEHRWPRPKPLETHQRWGSGLATLDQLTQLITIEPGHPLAFVFEIQLEQEEARAKASDPFWSELEQSAQAGWRFRTEWWSEAQEGWVVVHQNEEGHCRLAGVRQAFEVEWEARWLHFIRTFDAIGRAPVRAEQIVARRLRAALTPRQWDFYQLSGLFVEQSTRSKLWYIFRRLRPTIVLRRPADGGTLLRTLCLHPLGGFNEAFAGLLSPSADVLAQLLLMRADEHRYWKVAEQQPPWSLAAGL